MIEIQNLKFAYDKRFYALYNVNLKFFDGQKYMIFSEQELESQTLFRILSKQEKGYSGDILFDGKNLKEIDIKNLDICYITKELNLLKNKSVLYNIAYPLIVRKNLLKNEKYLLENKNNLKENNIDKKLLKNNKNKIKYSKNNAIKIAEKILEKYNLLHLKDKKIKNLTINEKILLILLRCTIRKPKIIFFDYFNFDLININLFFETIKNSLILFATTDKKLLEDFNKIINEKDEQFKLINFVGGSVEK